MEQKPAVASQPVDAGQFKIGMRTLAGAVNIITSMHSGHRYGMTATAVCSASAEPREDRHRDDARAEVEEGLLEKADGVHG